MLGLELGLGLGRVASLLRVACNRSRSHTSPAPVQALAQLWPRAPSIHPGGGEGGEGGGDDGGGGGGGGGGGDGGGGGGGGEGGEGGDVGGSASHKPQVFLHCFFLASVE